MQPRDDQPTSGTEHELAGRTYLVADVEPLDVDGVRTVTVGSIIWLVGFLALLPFYGRLADDGRTWMVWTCMAGAGLGLVGVEYCRRRRTARVEDDLADAGPLGGPLGGPGGPLDGSGR